MKNILFLSSVFFLLSSEANIRVGRTGGGLAEMKAYSIVAQIPSIIKICNSSQSSCGMKPAQKNDLMMLNERINLSKLQLVAPASGPTKLSGLTLSINSQDLYKSGTPLQFGQILSLCLYTLLRDGLRMNEVAARWPYQIFSQFEENMRSLSLANLNLTLHAISLKFPYSKGHVVQALALENSRTTDDLTETLIHHFGCTPTTWSIESWSYTQDQSWVRAQLIWVCSERTWSGELQLLVSPAGITRFGIVRRKPIR